jgi:hypothetical protein
MLMPETPYGIFDTLPIEMTARSNLPNSKTDHDCTANMSNNTQDVAMTGLSTELIDLLAQHLDKADLLSLRATCHKLRNDTAYQFCRRYVSNVSTSGTTSSVLESIGVLRSPKMPHAQHFARSLTVRAMLIVEGLVVDLDHLRKHLAPDQRDIVRLLAAMPNLQHIALQQDMVENCVPLCESPLLFFQTITTLDNPLVHLRSLYLHGLHLGDELSSMLARQTPSLRSVSFLLLTLTGNTKTTTTTWAPIIKTLCSLPLERFLLYQPRVLDQDGNSGKLTFPKHIYTRAETGYPRNFGGADEILASHMFGFNLTPVKPALKKLLRA